MGKMSPQANYLRSKFSKDSSAPSTLIELLRQRAIEKGDHPAYTFLTDGETETLCLTNGELDRQAQVIGGWLQSLGAAGERLVLLYPPGLEYIAAFFGCLYAGAVPVPAYPPRLNQSLNRLQSIVADAQVKRVLTTTSIMSRSGLLFSDAPFLKQLQWLTTDDLSPDLSASWSDPAVKADSLALLQYTSGSTSTPKGVMVTHQNLLHNERMIELAFQQSEQSVIVSWLPLYHDMGLIGGLLQPLHLGTHCVLMSPVAFLQRPFRWLQAISRFRATTSGAPNFAYDLCVRKISADQRSVIDLSSWQVAFNGSEPIRAETLDRFSETFEPCGFRREAFYPCYGLAEGTLLASARRSHSSVITRAVKAQSLKENRVEPETENEGEARMIVSCGAGLLGQQIIVVHPETLAKCSAQEVGEIWISGPSVAAGYWNNAAETARAFHAYVAQSGEGPFLRTGDLGFFSDGELFVAGRLKDLIIIRGLNYYPQDLEYTVGRSHPALRADCGAAFSVEVDGGEELVIVHELEARHKAESPQVIEAIRKTLAVTHEIKVSAIVLIRQGSLAKTSSGKVQRYACRAEYLADRLAVVAQWQAPLIQEEMAESAITTQPERNEESVETWLVSHVAALLHIKPSEIDPYEPISSYGIDSLSAIELMHGLEMRFGISLPMTTFLKSPGINELAAQVIAAGEESCAPAPEPEDAGILSHGQRALWFLHQLTPDSPAYNLAFAARIHSRLEVESLRRAFQSLVSRHSSLRSTFSHECGEPVQHVNDHLEVCFRQLDASGWDEQELRRYLVEEAQSPFDLERGPLLRVILAASSSSEFVLLLVMHHIIGDYWSLAVLLRELSLFYEAERSGRAPSLSSLEIEYRDYARRQQDMLDGPEGERLSTFWRSKLAGNLPVLNLPTDRPRPVVQSHRGGTEAFKLNRDLTAKLQALSQANGATLYMTLLAAFQTFLYRYCGQEDFLIGSPAAGRTRADVSGLIGYFVNFLVLRADLSGRPSFKDLLHRVRATSLAAFDHQAYPFSLLVNQLQPDREPSRSPLFDVVFALQGTPLLRDKGLSSFVLGEEGARVRLGGLDLESIALDQQSAQFDLTMMLAEAEDMMSGSLGYNADLFDRATVRQMVANFLTLLEGVVADPDRSVAEAPILSEDECESLFVRWPDASAISTDQVFVQTLVESQAMAKPDAVAVTSGKDSLTYRELNERANRLASYLRNHGVGAEQVVGLLMGRSVELIVGMLAIVKAGGAYLPLDPSYPDQRIRYLIEDSGATTIITQSGLVERLGRRSEASICLDREWERIRQQRGADPEVKLQPGNLAYAIYTSGSTGEPKGVMIEHRSLLGLVNWHLDTYGVKSDDRMPQLAGLGFDATVWEIWPCLAAGACLHLVPEEVRTWTLGLQQWLIEEQITISFLPTPLAEDLITMDWGRNIALRTVLTGGDRLRFYPPRSVPFELVNHYGPTEYTVVTTSALIPPDEGAVGPPTIGRPISNTHVYILDERLQPAPTGVHGEICISGEGLARGYLNRPELAAERFLANAFSRTPGQRLYRTGDLGRRLRDGSIEFLGRRDHQVKLRGYRIELGEIEVALLKHESVKEAVVLVKDDEGGQKRLAAYLVAQTGKALSPAELRQSLKAWLPDYMLPSAIIELEQLPFTAHGKLDREALLQIEPQSLSHAERREATPVEELLSDIWREALALGEVGPEENFFELGGHSLLATRIASLIGERFNLEAPLRIIFEEPTIAALGKRIEEALSAGVRGRQAVIEGGTTEEELSFAQQRMWFLDRLDPARGNYNVVGGIRFRGALEPAALERSFQEIVNRHDVLRTNFVEVGGRPRQKIKRLVPILMGVVDLSGMSETAREQEARRLARAEGARGFNLAEDELLRVRLIKIAEQEHVLTLTMHHIVTDGWSMRVLLREAGQFYNAYVRGEQPQLEPLKIQYRDYVAWQRKWLQGEELNRQLEYWSDRLGDEEFGLEIPGDRVRPAVMSHRGASSIIELSSETSEQVRRMSRREGVTVYMTLLAALKALLYRYTGQKEIAVGSPIANRRQTEVEELIGLFANTLVLGSKVEPDESFQHLLKNVREASLGAYAHQDVPFELVVERLRPHRDLSRTPLFQVMLAYENGAREELRLEGVEASWYEVDIETAKFDLTIYLQEQDGRITGRIEYSADLFEAPTIERMVRHYETLLRAAASDPSLCLNRLPLMERRELDLILIEWNLTEREYGGENCIHQLFESQAERTPDRIALIFENERVSYRALNERANQLSRYLRRRSVGPEVFVAIYMRRSVEMVIGMLAVHKAGGAYVPIDPSYPKQRRQFMLEDSRAIVVLTQGGLNYEDLSQLAQIVDVDSCRSEVDHESERGLENRIDGSNLAYVIYTSGSTGAPKGVGIQHYSAVSFLRWAGEYFSAEELAGVLASTSICFDLSVYELFGPLSCGGKVILAENALQLPDLVAIEDVTLINTVPSAMAALSRMPSFPPSVRTVNLAGEPLSSALVREIYSRENIQRVYNLYGPSEDTTYSTHSLVSAGGSGVVTIGRPISNTRVYILDGQLQPTPIGVGGEVCISGEGLARGYLGRPDSTAEKFIPNPFADSGGSRLYKTGDIGRYLGDGNIQFLGRLDHQVKIRGFRIELGEIESILRRHPEVKDVVAIVAEDGNDKRIVAYIVPKEEGAIVDPRGYLRERAPEYMTPSAIVMMDALPLTPNGKIDRKALPAAQFRTERPATAPTTPVEEMLASIWRQALNLQQVGTGENFFEIGGHSLLAIQVISRTREAFGVEIGVRKLFERPTIEGFSKEIEELIRGGEGIRSVSIGRAKMGGAAPLSSAQQRLWFLDQLEPNSAFYNLAAAVRLTGALDVDALERSINEVIRRHESLRTRFIWMNGEPAQVIEPELRLKLEVEDLGGLPEQERESQLSGRAAEQARQGFNLSTAPLMRVRLMRMSAREQVLVMVTHHIISDGWSMGILVREISLLYEAYSKGEEPELKELPIQYVDYVMWERERIRSGDYDEQLRRWEQRLRGSDTTVEAPADRPRPAVQSHRGAVEKFHLGDWLSEKIKRFSQRESATMYMALLAGLRALLFRYTGQAEINIGAPLANRSRVEVEGLIGFFVNTVVMRLKTEGGESFSDLIGRVREEAITCYANGEVPFEAVVEKIRPERDLSRSPLFQVMFAMENAGAEEAQLTGIEAKVEEIDSGTAKFDLLVIMKEGKDGITCKIEYNRDIFDAERIRRMGGHYKRLMESAVEGMERRISELELMSEEELEQVVRGWNRTKKSFGEARCLQEIFERQAESTGEAIAVENEGTAVTYAELNRRANQVGRYLRARGIGADGLVGVYMERGVEMVIGLLGALKSGGAYVPLDPSYPAERLSVMIKDTRTQVILTQSHLIETLPPSDAGVICLNSEWGLIARESEENLPLEAPPDNLAYVIYTSGSTGKPKGVMNSHRGIFNRLAWMQDVYRITGGDRVLQKTQFSFDVSVWEFFWPLLNGACLVMARPNGHQDSGYIVGQIIENKITVIHFVPSMLQITINEPLFERCESLNLVVCSGEALPRELQERFFTKLRCDLENLYGPTEAAVEVTRWKCEPGDGHKSVPIGRPIANVRLHLLDAQMQPVPAGITGELHIGGVAVARGYLNRADLTAEKFIPDPFGGEPGARLYRTGDLASYLVDGDIEFIGRIDHQVKIRGFRIELGEIEAALIRHPAVREAVVIARGEAFDRRLVGYVVVGEREAGAGELKGYLRERMPEYMVPSAIVTMDALPLTANGKIDRKALPAPDQSRPDLKQSFVAPATPTQRNLAEIWMEVLGLEQVGIHDDFFELGGHSLLATRMLSKAREALNEELTLRAIFESPTIAGISEAIERARQSGSQVNRPAIVAVSRESYRVKPASRQGHKRPKPSKQKQ